MKYLESRGINKTDGKNNNGHGPNEKDLVSRHDFHTVSFKFFFRHFQKKNSDTFKRSYFTIHFRQHVLYFDIVKTTKMLHINK